jgi:Ser/Thr protein kinase RdoA (MazF antagonist)
MNDPLPTPQPFSELTPHAVLDALAAAGFYGDGRMLQLNSYENRVFQVWLEDGPAVVAKFYRAGRWSDLQIIEEHAFAAELAAAEVPVAAPSILAPAGRDDALQCIGDPPTLAKLGALRFGVTACLPGRAPELDHLPTLEWIGRFIGRLHQVGRARPFVHRRPIDAQSLGWQPRDWLLQHGRLPDLQAERWAEVSQRALELVDQRFAAYPARQLRLHGDCHPGNLLWTDAGPHFVDLDDCANGPAVQDLWMLLPGELRASRPQLDRLLRGYETFCEFDDGELALIEPLRTLRMIHHSAWLAQRRADPAFPHAFPWFDTPAYWAQQVEHLFTQIELMSAP